MAPKMQVRKTAKILQARKAAKLSRATPAISVKSYKNHGWNMQVVNDPLQGVENVLIRRGVSNDTLGVMLLKGGVLEFWHNGQMLIRTGSFSELFAVVERVERRGL